MLQQHFLFGIADPINFVQHRFPDQQFFGLDEDHIGKEWIFAMASESRMPDVENIFSELRSVDDPQKKQLSASDEIKREQLAEDFKYIFESLYPGDVWKIWFWHQNG